MSLLKSVANKIQVPSATPDNFTVPDPIVIPKGVIYGTGFESPEYPLGAISPVTQPSDFRFSTPSSGIVVSNAQAKSGSQSVLFPFKRFLKEMRFHIGSSQKELWFSWDQYIPSNYFHGDNPPGHNPSSENNKFLTLWGGGNAGYNGDFRIGPLLLAQNEKYQDGSSGQSFCRLVVFSRIETVGQGVAYFNPGGAGGDGQGILIRTADIIGNGTAANPQGSWMKITAHIRYATRADWVARTGGDPNVAYTEGDGIYELWRTDYQGNISKIIDVNRGPFYATNSITLGEANGFDTGYLLGANNYEFLETTNVYVDNWIISTNPLDDFIGY